MTELAALLLERVPAARITEDASTLGVVLPLDDAWHSARIRTAPQTEIYVALPALDGFALTVSPASGRLLPRRDVPFDRRHQVITNDPALARHWLDAASAAAIASTQYTARVLGPWTSYTTSELRYVRPSQLAWTFALHGAELLVRRGVAEPALDRVVDVLLAGATVAGAAHRIARAWAEVARTLGGTATADRWDVAGAFAVLCERSGATVHIDTVRTLQHEETGDHRLRTRVRASRVTTHGDTLLLWRRGVPGYPPSLLRRLEPLRVPELADLAELRASASAPERGRRRLDTGTRALITAAQLDALAMDAAEISVWFEGMVMDARRLDAAVALCARLAIDQVPGTGPYR